MDTRTLGARYVAAALAGARRQGLDPAPMLCAAGISRALFDQPQARVTPDQFTRLVHVLWDALDDEFMGLGPTPSRRGTFAMMCHATIHCPDLGSALRRGFAFYRLFAGGVRMTLEVHAGPAVMSTDVRVDDPDRFLTESILAIWHRYSSWLVGTRIALRYADLAYPEPAHAAEYDLLFGCPARFDRPRSALVFDAAALRMPLVRDEHALATFLRAAPADLIARRDYGTTTADRVRRSLDRPERHRLRTLHEVAGELAMSEQTVRRRLRAEGTSFREVREEVLRDAAVASLARGAEPVEQLADRLGFSEASSFHRAFKRWTGATPGAYRHQLERRSDKRDTAGSSSYR